MVSLKPIHLQTRQLDFITRVGKQYVDGFAGEEAFEKPFNLYIV